MITTSSPGDTSRPVTSAISMSMHTEPTIGARRPRISTAPRPARRRSSPSAYPAGTMAMVVGRSAVKRAPYPLDLARPHPLHRYDAAAERHHGLERNRRSERRRNDAVEQKPGADPVEPDARSREGARRCWRRGDSAARPPSAATSASARSNRTRCSSNSGCRARPRWRSACTRRRTRGSRWPEAPAACVAGCRTGIRGGSCRCRFSGDSAPAVGSARRRPARPSPRRASRWSA